jgi:hypothetical protein
VRWDSPAVVPERELPARERNGDGDAGWTEGKEEADEGLAMDGESGTEETVDGDSELGDDMTVEKDVGRVRG